MTAPQTKPEILRELKALHERSTRYWRRELMARRETDAQALESAVEPWSEKALDRCRMPHPLLGKLTVREMLFFTLCHNLHHVQNVARRTGIGFMGEV